MMSFIVKIIMKFIDVFVNDDLLNWVNNYFGDNIGNGITIAQTVDKVTITNNHLNNNSIISVTKPDVLIANNLA